MESAQSVVSPFNNSSELEKWKSDHFILSSSYYPLSNGTKALVKIDIVCDLEKNVGELEVCIHKARDIPDICIYQKQDVYAKLFLTTDPENTVSTKIINSGGNNPIFNENFKLDVRTIDSSLKCDIWMLSRIKNYLEDQLLGFALVPLSEILINNGKLEKEFSLSSTDLFHSPAGFVQLSLTFREASQEVMPVSRTARTPLISNAVMQDSEIYKSLSSDLDKIEFRDPEIANEEHVMISEYFAMLSSHLDSQSSERLATSDANGHFNSETGARFVESFSANSAKFDPLLKIDTPPRNLPTSGICSPSVPESSQFSDAIATSKFPAREQVLSEKEKNLNVKYGESDLSNEFQIDSFAKPVATTNIEPKQKLLQQEIADIYMKSMQQFTESLAKIKLPLDIDSGLNVSGNSSSDQKIRAPESSGPRVFYGSNAFF